MSPRSEEFMAEARECLAAARDLIATSHPARAVGDAYYAMFYAARAALSEEDANAKTHSGIWNLFSDRFVRTGRIDDALFDRTKDAQRAREAADYDAATIEAAKAKEMTDAAEQFIDGIDRLLRKPDSQ